MLASLKLYTQPKMLILALLGMASGLPLALTASTLSIWLTEAGIDKTSIGLFAAVATPYAIKFLWSPLLDHLKIPIIYRWLGRRRSWMLITQVALIVTLVALGFADPAIDPIRTALMALLVAISSASQDIVVDAYRVESLNPNEQAAGSAAQVFGYRIGMLASGAGALVLAETLGWQFTYAVMAGVMIVGIVATVMAKEQPSMSSSGLASREPEDPEGLDSRSGLVGRPGMTRFKTALYSMVIEPFADFMRRDGWWIILLFVMLFKLGDALAGVMTGPFLIETGFTKSEIAAIVKTFGLAATLIGAFLGGWLGNRMSLIHALWLCGLLQMASNIMFIAQSYVGHDTWFLTLTITVENLSGGMGTSVFVAYLSSLCNVRFTATQYALLSSLAAAGRTWLSTPSGWFAQTLGWPEFFLLTVFAAIPGLIMLRLVQRR